MSGMEPRIINTQINTVSLRINKMTHIFFEIFFFFREKNKIKISELTFRFSFLIIEWERPFVEKIYNFTPLRFYKQAVGLQA